MSFNLAFAIARKRNDLPFHCGNCHLPTRPRAANRFLPLVLFVASLFIAPAAWADVPVASNVSVSGTPEVGQTLNGSYDYSDADDDLEDVGA